MMCRPYRNEHVKTGENDPTVTTYQVVNMRPNNEPFLTAC